MQIECFQSESDAIQCCGSVELKIMDRNRPDVSSRSYGQWLVLERNRRGLIMMQKQQQYSSSRFIVVT